MLRKICLVIEIIEGKMEGGIEVTGRRRIIRKQLLDLKEIRGYWILKEEVLDCTLLRTRFGSGCGPVVKWDMN
jgi:hypothetical protein